jgi:hypothetical protein
LEAARVNAEAIQSLRAGYMEQPQEVSIETFALCNARCTFCPYGTLGREGTKLPSIVINSLIAPGSSRVNGARTRNFPATSEEIENAKS